MTGPGSGSAGSGSSPYATGGGGTVLEHRYAAVLLSYLLSRTPLPELGDGLVPEEIRLQASGFSDVDDVVAIGRPEAGGEQVKTSIGVRRDPNLVKSNAASVALIGTYLHEVSTRWDEIEAGLYRLVLAVADRNVHGHQLAALTQLAAIQGAEDFRTASALSGPTNAKMRERLSQLDGIVAQAAAARNIDTRRVSAIELTWRLLSALRVHHMRLEEGDERDRTHAVERLRVVAAHDSAEAADALMGALEHQVGTYAPHAAHVTETRLRRDLGPRLRPPPQRREAPREQPEFEAGAVLRGPVVHLGLAADFGQATSREAEDPAAAADAFGQVAGALESSAWAPFAFSVREQQARSLYRAGQVAEGAAIDVAAMATAFAAGEAHRTVAIARRIAAQPGEVPAGLLSSAEALGAVAAFEYQHDVALEDVGSCIDALAPGEPYGLRAAVWWAEHAIATGCGELLRPRRAALGVLADGAAPADALYRARLHACLADADPTGDVWTSLRSRARTGYPESAVSLLAARHGRYLAQTGAEQESLACYDEAIEGAVRCGHPHDAGEWREARTLVCLRYGRERQWLAETYPAVRALRAARGGSVLPEYLPARERALARLAGRAGPPAVREALVRYLRLATAVGGWLAEREAHELLGRFHLNHAQPDAARCHLIAADASTGLEELGGKLPEAPVSLPVPELQRMPGWRRHAQFTAVTACADRLPDGQAQAWVEAALEELGRPQPPPLTGDRNPGQVALEALAALADATTTAQAHTILSHTDGLLRGRRYRRTARRAWVRTLLRLAQRHTGLVQVEATDRLCHALLTDEDLASLFLAHGEEVLSLQPALVRERCETAAAGGNLDAALALVLAQAPAEAARELARTLLPHPETGRSEESSASPAQAAILIGAVLPAADRTAFAEAQLAALDDQALPAHARQDALDALYTLAPHLEAARRAALLPPLLKAARGDMDAPGEVESSPPYDRFQIRLGLTTLRYHALSAAARLAHTPTQAQSVLELALADLLQPSPRAERLIADALAALSTAEPSLPLAILAGHPSASVRAFAARQWCAAPTAPADLAQRLAHDPEPRVRYTLARCLTDRPEHTALRALLRKDCRRVIRTTAGQQTPTTTPDPSTTPNTSAPSVR